jgi:RNA-directed DNA polymerase
MNREIHVRFCEGLGVQFPRATRLVVLARYISPQLQDFIENKIENWLDLGINREKTKRFDVSTQGQTLDFLGYSFRYDRSRFGGSSKYWNLVPSHNSLQRERDKLKEKTDARQCFKPLPKLIGELNTHLRGWANYFGAGYPRQAFREINQFTRKRLTLHVKRRSQRGYHPPKGRSFYLHFADLNLCYL